MEQRIFCPNSAAERNFWHTVEVKHNQVRRTWFQNALSEMKRLGVCLKTTSTQSIFFIPSLISFAVTNKIHFSRYCIKLACK